MPEEELRYKIVVDQSDLDKFTTRTAQAASKGVSQGTPKATAAPAGSPSGTPTPTPTPKAPKGAIDPQKLLMAQYRKLFSTTVKDLAKEGKPEKKDPRGGTILNHLKDKLGGLGGTGENTVFGQFLRTVGFGGSQRGPRGFLSHFLGNLPHGQPLTKQAVFGAAKAGIGGMVGGNLGAAMMAPGGLGLGAGMGGGVGAMLGMAGGPVGVAVMAAVKGIKMFASAMDDLVAKLGKYNAQTGAAMAQLEAKTLVFKIQMSQALEPIMTWWVNLKSKLLDILSVVITKVINILKALWSMLQAIMALMGPLVGVIKLLWEGFKKLYEAVKFVAVGFFTFAKGLFEKAASWHIPGAKKMAEAMQHAIDAWNQGNESLDEKTRGLMRNMFVIGKNTAGAINAGIQQGIRQQLPGAVRGGGFFRNRASERWHLRRTSREGVQDAQDRRMARQLSEREHLARTDPWKYMKTGGAGGDPQKGPWSYLNAVHRASGQQGAKGGQGAAGAQGQRNPQNTKTMPPTDWDTIKQNVEFNLDMKIQSEQAVQQAIFQVRDKLLQGLATARDETRLIAGMLDAGLSVGF